MILTLPVFTLSCIQKLRTSSASVLDLVTIVWRTESVHIGPDVPMVMHEPVCDLSCTCTPYDASKYPNGCRPAAPGVRSKPRCSLLCDWCRCRMILSSLHWSISVAFVTRVASMETESWMSGVVLLDRYRRRAIMVWKCRLRLSSSSGLSELVAPLIMALGVKILSALTSVVAIFAGNLLPTVMFATLLLGSDEYDNSPRGTDCSVGAMAFGVALLSTLAGIVGIVIAGNLLPTVMLATLLGLDELVSLPCRMLAVVGAREKTWFVRLTE